MIVQITPKTTPPTTERDYEWHAYNGDIEWRNEDASFYDATNDIFYPSPSFNTEHTEHVLTTAKKLAVMFDDWQSRKRGMVE